MAVCPRLKAPVGLILKSVSPAYSLNKDLHNVQSIYLLTVKRLVWGLDEVAVSELKHLSGGFSVFKHRRVLENQRQF